MIQDNFVRRSQEYSILDSKNPKENINLKHSTSKQAIVSSSSTSTIGCGAIMSEMRTKLIDIQNNKQYIEQKIYEYEKKLQLLKGGHNQSTCSDNIPQQTFGGGFHGMTKSSSSLLVLNSNRMQ